MQGNDAIEVVAPLGTGISEVSFPDAAAVLAGTAGVLAARSFTPPDALYHRLRATSACEEHRDPLIGMDGEIAGVLCRDSPLNGASRSTPPTQDRDSAIIGEAKTIRRDIANLLATIDCELWLLRRQTEVEARQLIVDRMRHSIQCGAASRRNFLGGDRIPQSGHTDIATRRSLHAEIAQDLSDVVADPEYLYLALLHLRRNASVAPHYHGQVVISAKNSAPALTGAVEIIVASNGSGMTHEVLWRAFDSNFTTNLGNVRVSVAGQVQQFVQESGGAIEIKSEISVGTAVRVILLPYRDRSAVRVSNRPNFVATF